MSTLFDITGRLALVTGSSRGIGLALARGLVEHGCSVVVNGRDPDAVAVAATALRQDARDGARVHEAPFDATDAQAVRAAVGRLEAEVGAIDILVNNTGMQNRKPVTEFGDDEWHRILDTNLTTAFYVSREVARAMTARGAGRIVNICSLQSMVARPGIAPYSATKGGLLMLTKGLCADLAPHGITVNAIGPGYFDTELTAALVADEQFSSWVRGRTPAGRWGDVRDLVGTLVYLVSPASSFVNGQIVYVDGGMTSVL
ncbi:SDR family oxidoreductase [Nostocoides sp. Soil756]|jgi:gluconate 5-dehydrogenase|uniref:SDR family oxidoreductase n=1 Tax=Nostocoides sp. Soil756 TaxID=1736399 RepID=UPI0006F4BD14|nr:SDR family oxidoreductase [Tetrasphaera sp. Soil756]KRE63674.1 gluconate 5-dehydrogenase [Tetrasphaera sp. Soil756]